MNTKGAADECHNLQLGLLIGDGWGDGTEDPTASPVTTRGDRLRQVVSEAIVPRLALIHENFRRAGTVAGPTPEEIDEFGRIVVGADPSQAEGFFERLRERGLTVDALFETLLVPTARRLGELWFEDVVDFVDVALGVNRLRILLEMYSNAPVAFRDQRRRALLVAPREEGHVFGLDVVASFLRASGWDVVLEFGRTIDEIALTAASQWFAVVGVSIGDESHMPTAARAIEAMRRASLNPAISVMVGGWACHGRPDLVARAGADASAEDGPGAALLAQRLYIRQTTSALKPV